MKRFGLLLLTLCLIASSAQAQRMRLRCQPADPEWHWIMVFPPEEGKWQVEEGIAKNVLFGKGKVSALLYDKDPGLKTYPTDPKDVMSSDALYFLNGTVAKNQVTAGLNKLGTDADMPAFRGRILHQRDPQDPWSQDRIVLEDSHGDVFLGLSHTVQRLPPNCPAKGGK